jgi:deoxyribonuclease-4
VAPHPIGVHIGPGLTDDNQLLDGGPLARAAEMDADGVQIFLTDPQSYKAPKPRPDAADLLAGDVMVVVHAPYLLNVASTNNRIRIPSRKLLDQHAKAAAAVGAVGLVVHGGHVLARDLDALGRLFDAVGEFGAGFVLDTCHAWAAGWDLATAVGDVRAVTGRIDLVHLNNSRDPHGSSRDRHAPVDGGEIPRELLVEVARAADCPVVLETPGDAAAHAEEVAGLRAALQG